MNCVWLFLALFLVGTDAKPSKGPPIIALDVVFDRDTSKSEAQTDDDRVVPKDMKPYRAYRMMDYYDNDDYNILSSEWTERPTWTTTIQPTWTTTIQPTWTTTI